MNDSIVSCKIYIAGQSPNSAYAVQNLMVFCRRYLPNRHKIEIVDVFVDPDRALKDRIFLTPTLVIASPSPSRSIVGDLSDNDVLLKTLSVEIAASGARASAA